MAGGDRLILVFSDLTQLKVDMTQLEVDLTQVELDMT